MKKRKKKYSTCDDILPPHHCDCGYSEDDLYLNLRLFKQEQERKKQELIKKQLNKIDFLLPRYIMGILSEDNFMNIDWKPFDYYSNPFAMRDIIIPNRLKYGVYQNIKCIFPKEGARRMCWPITRFSISLN